MNGLLKPLEKIETFNKLVKYLEEKNQTILTTNVIDSQKIHLGTGILKKLNKSGLYITHSELKAKEIFEDLKYFLGDKVKFYPTKDILFYNADVRSLEITKQRFDVINSLIKNEDVVVVLSVEALFDRIISKEIFVKNILNINILDVISQDDLKNKLVFMGYERSELVEGQGQFSVRGGIIDIFPINLENGIRLEFWGDEIDSIRLLDPISQRSIEKLETIEIFPCREIIYTEEELKNGIEKIKKEFSKTLKEYDKKGLYEEKENLNNNINKIIEKMENLKNFSGIENYTKFLLEEENSLIDYFDPNNTIIFFDEPNRILNHSETILHEFNESIKNRILKGYILPSSINMIYSYGKIISDTDKFSRVLLISLTQSIKEFKIKEIFNFSVKSSNILSENINLLIDDLKYYTDNDYKILILGGASRRCENLLNELTKNNFSCEYVKKLEDYDFKNSVITISNGNLTKGFEYIDIKFVVITDKEIFSSEYKKKKRKKKKHKGSKIESFIDLKIGDYIAHENHGIGIYKGIENITTENIARDYLKLAYADGGHLYIPTNQMDMIQKYIGASEGTKVRLNKLGGTEWSKTKSKAKGNVEILAKDLIKLYAKRKSRKGYTFSEDTIWQKEFEDSFPFEETNDQLIAIEEIKKDMESDIVMERLLCGDVGYGKTEVALRASFKAVQDGKQIAYLVPTTILAQQHYNTFKERMADYPINVEMLSRFRTPKEQKETKKGLLTGEVDIVVGTHGILSKDMKFKDLGLIIIDEEQRFGVAQKEKLKQMKENVDVLSLSATPIPRTLHMSLSGIRDISLLEDPPEERQPIQTYVMEFNEEFVREAINRELNRNGQVFYLHNRVRNIDEVTNNINNLVPNARIEFAHGQMSERELEQIMIDFIEGQIDVLVCTTIIETGLDISNANTIIIQDADYMGLSQLYQLRGRVGRSNRNSFAYLMYKKDKVLTEIAEKRLQTIKEFTEFGSGFKIAMRDLEIRGAGNILGGEQHGHISNIGYDFYYKLLDEEIRKLQGEKIEESFETTIDIIINAYIPNYYIKNELQKLEMYKKISYIKNLEDYYDVQEEIEDRYGNLPFSVQNLLEIAFLKSLAHNKGVISLSEKNNNIIIVFKEDANVNIENLTNLIKENKNNISFTTNEKPYLTYKNNGESESKSKNILKTIKEILEKL